jgi:hypothetical protein
MKMLIGETGNSHGLRSHDLSRWVIVKEYEPVRTNASYNEIVKNFVIPKELRIWPQDLRPETQRVKNGRSFMRPNSPIARMVGVPIRILQRDSLRCVQLV